MIKVRRYRAVAKRRTRGADPHWRGSWYASRVSAERQARRWARRDDARLEAVWVEASDGERFELEDAS